MQATITRNQTLYYTIQYGSHALKVRSRSWAVPRSASWSLESTRRCSSSPRSTLSRINWKRIAKCLLLPLQWADLAKLSHHYYPPLPKDRRFSLCLRLNSSANFLQKAKSWAQLVMHASQTSIVWSERQSSSPMNHFRYLATKVESAGFSEVDMESRSALHIDGNVHGWIFFAAPSNG